MQESSSSTKRIQPLDPAAAFIELAAAFLHRGGLTVESRLPSGQVYARTLLQLDGDVVQHVLPCTLADPALLDAHIADLLAALQPWHEFKRTANRIFALASAGAGLGVLGAAFGIVQQRGRIVAVATAVALLFGALVRAHRWLVLRRVDARALPSSAPR